MTIHLDQQMFLTNHIDVIVSLLVDCKSLQPSSEVLRYLLKNTNMNKNCQEKSKFHKLISKRRIISLLHNSVLRRIWLNFMAQYLFLSALLQFAQFFFQISNFFGLSTTEKT
jgi:hypothetical protein